MKEDHDFEVITLGCGDTQTVLIRLDKSMTEALRAVTAEATALLPELRVHQNWGCTPEEFRDEAGRAAYRIAEQIQRSDGAHLRLDAREAHWAYRLCLSVGWHLLPPPPVLSKYLLILPVWMSCPVCRISVPHELPGTLPVDTRLSDRHQAYGRQFHRRLRSATPGETATASAAEALCLYWLLPWDLDAGDGIEPLRGRLAEFTEPLRIVLMRYAIC